jgi:hypothetical protein
LSGNSWLTLLRSGSGNGRVATVTPSGAHRPSRCRDQGCERPLCTAYREGREDGYDDGYEDGYRAGYAAGAAAASKK